jgi:hypothetical protein
MERNYDEIINEITNQARQILGGDIKSNTSINIGGNMKGIYIAYGAIPFVILLGLVVIKPNFIMYGDKDDRRIYIRKLLLYTIGISLPFLIGVFIYSKKKTY